MSTIQTNVRVQPDDKPLVRAIAARLRLEPRFRERLRALLEDDPTPALKERIERLEEMVERLISAAAGERNGAHPLHAHALPLAARAPTNGGHAS